MLPVPQHPTVRGKRTAKPEPPAGCEHMSSRPATARRPARADAKRSIWPELSTRHPVPQHRADRRSGREAEHSAGVISAPGPAGRSQPEPPRCRTWLGLMRGVVDGRPLGGMAARIHGGTDFVAMDCRIRATSPGSARTASAETEALSPMEESDSGPVYVIPSRTTAPAGRSGREAEDPVGVIYMPYRSRMEKLRADRRKRTAKPELPGWGRHTCHPVPQHRAARRKRTAKPEHSPELSRRPW